VITICAAFSIHTLTLPEYLGYKIRITSTVIFGKTNKTLCKVLRFSRSTIDIQVRHLLLASCMSHMPAQNQMAGFIRPQYSISELIGYKVAGGTVLERWAR
jgi:hypothetical protein